MTEEDSPTLKNIKSTDWKTRHQTYQSLQPQEITPEIVKTLTKETNIPVLEAGVSLLLTYKPPSLYPHIVPLFANLCTSKASLKSKILEIFFYILDNLSRDVVGDLFCFLDFKNPKLVCSVIVLIKDVTKKYGVIYNVEGVNLSNLLLHSDSSVRREAMVLIVEIYKTYKERVLNYIKDVKPIILKNLEEEFSKVREMGDKGKDSGIVREEGVSNMKIEEVGGVSNRSSREGVSNKKEVKPVIIKEEILKVREEGLSNTSSKQQSVSNSSSKQHPVINTPSKQQGVKLDEGCYDMVKSMDWKERKKGVEEIYKYLKGGGVNEGRAIGVLSKMVSDINLQVVLTVLDCLGCLEKRAFQSRKELFLNLCDRFKDKKSNLTHKVNFVLERAEAEEMEIVEILDTKNCNVKSGVLEYLIGVVQRKKELFNLESLTYIYDCTFDASEEVRNKAIKCIGCVMVFNEKKVSEFLVNKDKSKITRIREISSKEGVIISSSKESVRELSTKEVVREVISKDGSSKDIGKITRSKEVLVHINNTPNNNTPLNISIDNNTPLDTNLITNTPLTDITPSIPLKRRLSSSTNKILKKSISNRKVKNSENIEEYFTEEFISKIKTVKSKEDIENILSLFDTLDKITVSDYIITFLINNDLLNYIKPLLLYFIERCYILQQEEVRVLIKYILYKKEYILLKMLDKVFPISKLFIEYERVVDIDRIGVSKEVSRLVSLHGIFRGNANKYDGVVIDCINREMGDNNKVSDKGDVNDSTYKQEGVSNRSGDKGGVSNSTNKEEGVNISTYEQHPFNNTLYKQQGVIYGMSPLSKRSRENNVISDNIKGIEGFKIDRGIEVNNKETEGYNSSSDSRVIDRSFSLLNIRGVNDIESNIRGVDDKDGKLEGDKDIESIIRGVNDKDGYQYPNTPYDNYSTDNTPYNLNTDNTGNHLVDNTPSYPHIPYIPNNNTTTTYINTPFKYTVLDKFRKEFDEGLKSQSFTSRSDLQNILTRLIDSNTESSINAFKSLNTIIDNNISCLLFSCNSIVSSILIQMNEFRRNKKKETNKKEYSIYILQTLFKLTKNSFFSSYLSLDTLKSVHLDLISYISDGCTVIVDILINLCLLCECDVILRVYLSMLSGNKGDRDTSYRCSGLEGVSGKDDIIKGVNISTNIQQGVSNSINIQQGVNTSTVNNTTSNKSANNNSKRVNFNEVVLKLIWRNSKAKGYLTSRVKTQSVLKVLEEFYEKGVLRLFKDDVVALRVVQLHLEEIIGCYGSSVYDFNINGLLKVYVECVYKRMYKC